MPQRPFSLTDFNRNRSGDVDVEIGEAGGRVRHFTLAQASKGNWPYVISFGYADATLKAHATAYSVSTAGGSTLADANLSSTLKRTYGNADGEQFIGGWNYTLHQDYGGYKFLFSAVIRLLIRNICTT